MSPTQLSPAKRIDIIIEQSFAESIIALLQDNGAQGYTVLPTVMGDGHQGLRGQNDIVDVFQNVLIICIVSESKLENLVTLLSQVLPDLSGIFWISDVHILRPEHF